MHPRVLKWFRLEDLKMFNIFVTNIFLAIHIVVLLALCGKRRTTTRNTNKPAEVKNKKVPSKEASTSAKKPAPVPKVIGCQPTREDEGMETETDTRTRTNSDERHQKEQNSKGASEKSTRALKTGAAPRVMIVQPIITKKRLPESKTLRRVEEPSAKVSRKSQENTRSESSEEMSENLEVSKKSVKSQKDEDKSSTLESIQTEEDELVKH